MPLEPPLGFGYYDLMNYETRRQHAVLAKQYGINGFIYHHYFFYRPSDENNYDDSLLVLSKPMLQMLKDGEPDLPFAFNWAADSWTSTWHGSLCAIH